MHDVDRTPSHVSEGFIYMAWFSPRVFPSSAFLIQLTTPINCYPKRSNDNGISPS